MRPHPARRFRPLSRLPRLVRFPRPACFPRRSRRSFPTLIRPAADLPLRRAASGGCSDAVGGTMQPSAPGGCGLPAIGRCPADKFPLPGVSMVSSEPYSDGSSRDAACEDRGSVKSCGPSPGEAAARAADAVRPAKERSLLLRALDAAQPLFPPFSEARILGAASSGRMLFMIPVSFTTRGRMQIKQREAESETGISCLSLFASRFRLSICPALRAVRAGRRSSPRHPRRAPYSRFWRPAYCR